ncbi:MAG: hypothetical protein KY395_00385 [Actinobacteria bacterium]|nr:hypothetical protein [Actinomycetota bacterium]
MAGLRTADQRHERAVSWLALVHPARRVAYPAERLAPPDAVAVGAPVDVQLASGRLAARVEEVTP